MFCAACRTLGAARVGRNIIAVGGRVKLETLSVRVGRDVDAASGAVTPPLHTSTTFERDADGEYPRGYSYIRPENPTRRALEQCLAALEGGADAMCFASGVAASLAVFSMVRPG